MKMGISCTDENMKRRKLFNGRKRSEKENGRGEKILEAEEASSPDVREKRGQVNGKEVSF